MTDKLWGGRFTEKAAHWVDAFGASISFDQQMAKEDCILPLKMKIFISTWKPY